VSEHLTTIYTFDICIITNHVATTIIVIVVATIIIVIVVATIIIVIVVVGSAKSKLENLPPLPPLAPPAAEPSIPRGLTDTFPGGR
jgi:hypothetical protein